MISVYCHQIFIILKLRYRHLFQKGSIVKPLRTFSLIVMTLLCINHFPSHAGAVYFSGDKNALGLTIMMICDMSSQQFQPDAILVREQIGSAEWRVGMCSPETGRDKILICHLALVAMETGDFSCIMMEPVGYRNGWGRNGKWVAGDNPSLCV